MQEFFVANYRVDILRNQIVREDPAPQERIVIALEPKVLEVLKVLAEHSGDVVSHQVLHDRVWPDIVVAPNALQRCIGQLRKALDDDGKTQRVIVTHPKKGYSLVAPVSFHTDLPETTKSLTLTPAITPAPDSKQETAEAPKTTFELPAVKIGVFVAAAILAILTLYTVVKFQPANHSPLQKFTQLKPLTATDASEFYSTFSPDGRYVAFSRDVPFSVNTTSPGGHMWVIDTTTGQESQLTQQSGRYGQPNWSSDGKQLAFLNLDSIAAHSSKKEVLPVSSSQEKKSSQKNDSAQNKDSPQCVDINLLYVPLALKEPQPVKTILSCENIPLQGLQWIDNTNLIAIVSDYSRTNNSNQLIRINSQTNEVTSLYKSDNVSMYALSWSDAKKQLAVMQARPQQTPSVLLFSPETMTATTQKFTAPIRYRTDTRWYPIWHPTGEQLLFSAASRLYLMDLDGNLESQVIPTFQDISRPMFHPDGTSIAMTLGKVDRDIAQLRLIPNQNEYEQTPIARSILRENDAQYQPNGNKIAFFSQRSGTRQLWLSEGKIGGTQSANQNGNRDAITKSNANKSNTVRQLFQLDDIHPEYFVWSPNGKQLAISTQRLLFLVDLHGNTNTIELPFDAIRLYQWTPDNQLLMQIADNDDGQQERTKLVRYDMSQNSYHTEHAGQTIWAQIHWPDNQLEQQKDSEIWFIDSEHRLKHIEQNQSKIFDKTAHIKTRSRFFIKDQQLYLFSDDRYFWKLALPNKPPQTDNRQIDDIQGHAINRQAPHKQSLQSLHHYLYENVRFTDASHNGEKLLISKQMSSKKEIVLLTP